MLPCLRLLLLLSALLLEIVVVDGQKCDAGCSPHVTLPCSFGSLDPCMARKCKEMCAADGSRPVIGCFCRGVQDGPALRTCFCGLSPDKAKNHTIIVF